jgi:hypothetical protein
MKAVNMKRNLAATILFGLVLALAAACASASEQPSPTQHEPTLGGVLLVSNRSQLSICVDGGAGLGVSESDVDRVRGALTDALAEADSVPTEYSDWRVSQGCPPPVALIGWAVFIP